MLRAIMFVQVRIMGFTSSFGMDARDSQRIMKGLPTSLLVEGDHMLQQWSLFRVCSPPSRVQESEQDHRKDQSLAHKDDQKAKRREELIVSA